MFDDRLKKIREEMGLTQKQAAELLELNPRTYSSYENNEREPPYEIILRIANTFNVSLDLLLGMDEKRVMSREFGRKQDMQLTTSEFKIVSIYRQLPPQGKELLQQLTDMLKVYYSGGKPDNSQTREEIIAERIAAADKKIAEEINIQK